jgi:hypothetical protein
VAQLVKSKDALRKWLVTDTLVPLVLKWIDSEEFVRLDIKSVRERTNFWVARIKEDKSLLAWWLKPLGSVLNLQWLFQPDDPPTEDLRELKMRMIRYCRGRMTWTADIVYLHLSSMTQCMARVFSRIIIRYDSLLMPSVFDSNYSQVTAKLLDIKLIQSVSRWEVPIQDWPFFANIKKPQVVSGGPEPNELGVD